MEQAEKGGEHVELTIVGSAKEIASLVQELQGMREKMQYETLIAPEEIRSMSQFSIENGDESEQFSRLDNDAKVYK